MKDFEEKIQMLLSVAVSGIKEDRREFVDEVATRIYNLIAEEINKEEMNNLEALAIIYSAMLEAHGVVTEGMEEVE